MKALRVLLVGKGPPDRGGIAATLRTLMARLEPPIAVELLNLTRPATYIAGVLSLRNVFRTIEDVGRVFRAAKGFDVVNVHSAFVPAVTIVRAGLLAIAARMRRARVVLHVHGGGLPGWNDRRWKSWLIAASLKAVDITVAVSDEVGAAVRRAGCDVTVIPNGVDSDVFTPNAASRGVPVVLYVGLLTERKGVVDLMEASRELRSNGIAHRLVLVGGRPDEGEAAEERVRRAASGEEDFVGVVPHEEMPDWYRSADVFCLPSWFEAMPLAVLEAMSCGLPVVATAVGQIPTMVDDSVGRLVPPRDPAALAAALAPLLENPEVRARLGGNARDRVEQAYSLEATLERVSAVYEAAAPGGKR